MNYRNSDKVEICIIHPADPIGTIPGGIDTFLRGTLRWAPDDISLSLIGVTTDRMARPVGKWTKCDLGRRSFNFFPVAALDDPGGRTKIPLTIRFAAALAATKIGRNFDVLEFHRIEPSLLYYFSSKPKNIFIHSNMEVLRNKNSDIRWKSLPWLYFKFEDILLPRMSSVFAVREDAIVAYQKRYPMIAERFHFTPTCVDPELFHPVERDAHTELKAKLGKIYGFDVEDSLLISVGRLDHSKDPLLLLDAFAKVSNSIEKIRLLFVGDGVLRDTLSRRILELGLVEKVILVGLRSVSEVADLLRISGIFVLSSAYEGMPMCVLEALGSGVPVASTDVGEVRRVVKPGVNGEIATERSPDALAEAILSCFRNHEKYYGDPCIESVSDYVPQKVLAPIYENYRKLAREGGDASKV